MEKKIIKIFDLKNEEDMRELTGTWLTFNGYHDAVDRHIHLGTKEGFKIILSEHEENK